MQDALAKANGVASVGHFDFSYQRHEIRVTGLLRGESDIRAVTVATRGGVPVLLSDLATVSRAVQPQTILASGNGAGGKSQPAVVNMNSPRFRG